VSSVTTGLSVAEIAELAGVPGPLDLVRVVAVDGPAGTGKSTVSRELARALGWRFVDTGATYRAATLAVVRAGIDPHDAERVLQVVGSSRIDLVTDPAAPRVVLDEQEVSTLIRTDEVTRQVSAVSSLAGVRQLLIAVQRLAMGTHGAVVEGRDIATVVAPLSGLKVYLDARPEVRARRRAGDSSVPVADEAGTTSDRTGEIGQALLLRDSVDSQTNKLEASEGAVHLDTSDLTLDQVVTVLLGLVHDAGLNAPEADR
jgi:cytidylate kinase